MEAKTDDVPGESILLRTLDDFLAGGRSPESLWRVLEESADEVAELRSIFRTSVSAQPPQVRERCRDEIIAVEYNLDEYEKTLGVIGDGLRDSDIGAVEVGAAAVRELAGRLNVSLLEFRDCALWASGPTSHGKINVILALLDRIIAGVDGDDAAGRLLCEARSELALAEAMDGSLDAAQAGELKEFYRSYLRLLELLAARLALAGVIDFGDGDGEPSEGDDAPAREVPAAADTVEDEIADEELPDFEALRRDFEALAQVYGRIDLLTYARSYGGGPTAIPFVNVIMRTARLVIDGEAPAEALTSFLDVFHEILEQFSLGHREIMKFETRSAVIVEVGEQIDDILGAIEGAVAEYRAFMKSPSEEALAQCEATLLEAARRLEPALEELRHFSEREDIVHCIRCGAPNVVGTSMCSLCKAVLPTAGIDAPSFVDMLILEPGASPHEGQPQMTANVQRLFEGASRRLEGALAPAEFLSLVGELERLLAISLRTARHIPVSPAGEQADAVTQAAGRYRDGLVRFQEGLALFREFAASPDIRLLERAQAIITEAAGLLQEMQALLEPVIRGGES